MKNKKLLKYFTEKILPILDEIEFNDTEHEADFNDFNVYYTEHEEYIKAQETLNQALNKYKLKFNSNAIATGEINNNPMKDVDTIVLEMPKKIVTTETPQFPFAA
mgnify:CR=1 FL=1